MISTACMCAYCRLGATHLCVEAYTAEVYRKVSAYCAAAASMYCMYWETSRVGVKGDRHRAFM